MAASHNFHTSRAIAHRARPSPRLGKDASLAAARAYPFTFGAPPLDAALGAEGLVFGSHQIAGERGEGVSAMLFALLAMGRRLNADPSAQALVVQERAVLAENGGLCGPGLHALGLEPDRIAFLAARNGEEALRMTDEAIRSGSAAVVLAEFQRGGAVIDLSSTRRFNLFGRQTATVALLITPDLDGTSAAMTRWRVSAAPSRAPRRFVGAPTLEVELVRNRLGPVGRFTIEWSSKDVRFRSQSPAPLRAPMVRASVDGPTALHVRRSALGGGGDAQECLTAGGGR